MATPTRYVENFRSLKFVALDGEGVTVGENHYYDLFVARCNNTDEQSVILPDERFKRLRTGEIFFFLTHLPRKDRIYVMFYFNYDVVKWLEDMEPEYRTQLWKNKHVVWTDPLLNKTYEIDYIPHKIFRIAERYENKWRKLTIYDVFGFFQCSFVKALLNWKVCDEETIEFIENMKQSRANFKKTDIETVTKYCAMECDLLCQLMNKVRNSLANENIIVKSWFGAGAVGQALLQREKMEPYIQPRVYMDKYNRDADFRNAVMGAYFGGRFELMRQGIINTTYQYDINSAYPYAMTSIPNLANCTIISTREYKPSPFALWFVTYNVIKKIGTPLFGPFPYREHSGTVHFPYINKHGVWVHAIELQTAMRLYGKENFQVIKGYIFKPKYDNKPFNWIRHVAERRLRLKAKGDLSNIVLKLGLNSLYGKMAQGIAATDKKPPFQNYYLAGYVTAHCRSQLLSIAWTCGNNGSDVIQFATDGIFSRTPSRKLGIKSSETLGEWEYTKHITPICYLQAGLYYGKPTKTGEAFKTKRRTRGIRAGRLSAEEIFRTWNTIEPFESAPTIDASDKRFIGLGTCMVFRKWDNYGKWIDFPHQLSFDAPPTKQYICGDTLLPRIQDGFKIGPVTMMWNERKLNIIGITENEVTFPKSNYFVLLSSHISPKIASEPYPLKKQLGVLDLDNLDDKRREIVLEDINLTEQGDYDTVNGFFPIFQ